MSRAGAPGGDPLAELLAREPQALYLVTGDLVLAEPAARRLADALAQRAGCAAEIHRRPTSLAPLLDDLATYSLFAAAKVVLAVDTAVLADRAAAASLIDAAAEVLPLDERSRELSGRERQAASRLFQALRLFGVEPASGAPEELLGALPDWALAGGKEGGRGAAAKKAVVERRAGLARLLAAAREAGIAGWAEGDLEQLGAITSGGLPRGHVLVLAESAVASGHPLVTALAERGAVLEVGRVAAGRRGWEGLDEVLAELEEETRVGIAAEAREELVRRVLRRQDWRGQAAGADPASLARLAAEYRKLAGLVEAGGRIETAVVEAAVEDRGEEDVWQVLDAIGSGRGAEALERARRLLHGAEDQVAARLSLFSLLAAFCRQLFAVVGMMEVAGAPPGERSFERFKSRLAPGLQAPLPGGGRNPLAGLHPYRLYRVYLAASRMPREEVLALPWLALQTELALKGESGEPESALTHLVLRLAS